MSHSTKVAKAITKILCLAGVVFCASSSIRAATPVPIQIFEIPASKPVLGGIGAQSVDEGQTLELHVTATDADTTIPALSAINLPTNASFADSTTGGGLFTFTPDFTQAGVYNVSFIASDGSLDDTLIVAITVTNVNRVPALTSIGAQSVDEGQTLDVHVTVTDPDDTTPTLTAINLPTNASFADSTTGGGLFTFTPDFTQAGVYNVSFIASDGTLDDTLIVAITVTNVNRVPALTSIGAQSVDEGQTLDVHVTATDPDGTTPTLTAINLPTNASFADSTTGGGLFTFTPDFTQAGVYNVSFIASDGSLDDTLIVAITVVNVNQKPILAAIGGQSVDEGQTLDVHITATDPDGTTPTLSAINLPTNASFADSTTGGGLFTFTPDFTQAGVYNVSFIASDGTLDDTLIVAITVTNVNRVPALTSIGAQSVNEGQTLDVHVTATDPDDTTPTLTAINLPTNASFADSTTGGGLFTFTPDFTQAGVYNVSFIASDGSLDDTLIVAITVVNVNQKPILAAIGGQSVDEGQTLDVHVTATDPDGTTPTLSAINLPTNAIFADSLNGAGRLTFSPSFTQTGVYDISVVASDGSLADTQIVTFYVGNVNRPPVLATIGSRAVNEATELSFSISATDPDGTTSSLTTSTLPAGAVFTDNGNNTGTFTWTPTYSQAGNYAITFRASDGLLVDSEVVAVTVNNVNRKPVLAAMSAQSVDEGQTLSVHVTATDPDGTTPNLSALNLPVNATLTDSLNGAGKMTFSPSFTQAGVYNVSFIAGDGTLADTLIVAVTVNNVNRKPVVASIGAQSVNEGQTLDVHVTATDPDGATPALSVSNLPANATFTDSLTGAGKMTFSPDFTQAGVYNVSFIASDGALADTLIVAITVINVNRAPVLAAIGAQSVNEGQSLLVHIVATDPDGTTPALSSINLPANAGLTDSTTGGGLFTFNPDSTQVGVYNISFVASDGSLADTLIVTVYVGDVNRPPVLATIENRAVNEATALNFSISAADPDGTTSTLTTSTLPAGAVFTDNGDNTGTFTWTPTYSQAGNYGITFRASDGLLTDSEVVIITVNNVNRAPVLSAIGNQTVNEKNLLSHNVSASDPDGAIAALATSSLPTGATFVDKGNGTGMFSWTPTFGQLGDYSITFRASDGSLVDSEVVSVTVNGARVYPGDADNNGVVNALDILPVAVHFMATGSSRDAATLEWTPQPSVLWPAPQATYADINGDGVVNERDIIGIGINWSNMHVSAVSSYEIDPLSPDLITTYQNTLVALYRSLSGDAEPVKEMRALLGSILGEGTGEMLPTTVTLDQNYPNPFNPTTTIRLSLPRTERVTLTVYDVVGHVVFRPIMSTIVEAGCHTYTLDFSGLASGVYFYRLETKTAAIVRTMVFIK